MPIEILHFRNSDKILAEKNLDRDLIVTMEYVELSLEQAHFKGELLRQALEEMDWRGNDTLNILDGRRYQYKGFKKGVAIEGNFSAYEYILDGLVRLQIGFDKGLIECGILLLTSKRSEKSPYGTSSDMAKVEMEMLHPTISLPVTIALYDLGNPDDPDE